MKVRNIENLTMSIAYRYYAFLLRHHREDVVAIARSMNFIVMNYKDIKIVSRIIQRHLYRLARNYGWRRVNNRWIKEKLLREEVRACLD